MRITLDPSDDRPVYMQIVDEIRRVLIMGIVAPGESLPSVRQLAVELRINPNTVSQAYQELERLGLVEARRGQGTFACANTSKARERSALLREVATRAIRDAHRHGLSAQQLIQAIRAVDNEGSARAAAWA